MPRSSSWPSVVAAFTAGVTVGVLITWPRRPLPPPPPPIETPSASPVTAVIEPTSSPTAGAIVSRVIDGDTIELKDGRKVRYLGIDSPETSRDECFAAEAKTANERLVLSQTVRLERDVTDTDRFGRLLRYVYVGDTFVNLALVRDGFASASTYPPDVRHAETFRRAAAEARQAKRGLWGGCTTGTPPAEVSPTAGDAPNGCVIKGNINAKGEKIYHLPGCGSYEKTVIEVGKGEQWFCTETDAVAMGFRKAGNCP